MHSISHSLAHRGPGASSRARTRFQPYSSQLANPTTPSTRSPPSYLHTPASSSSSSTPSTTYISPISTIERSRRPSVNHITSSTSQVGQFREAQKSKYVTRLVDQAVNSLCEIWKPEDIPHAFRTTSQTAYSAPMPSEVSAPTWDASPLTETHLQSSRNIQLPSPISPSTQPSPITASPFTSTTSISPEALRSNHLIPIRGFVHEVLRRSRTSTGVLQTALCYLEAVRGKVPELLRKEKAKASSEYVEEEQDPASRIIMGSAADFEDGSIMTDEPTAQPGVCRDLGSDFMDVERISVDPSVSGPLTAPPTEPLPSMDATEQCVPPIQVSSLKKPSPPLPPLPPLPSPLLCPRRTFLACLILASKFMQDRSYSNRAWAKLAGLPPREIGRCERALGEVLEWRLWVGKGPAPASAPAPCVGAHRAVARCRSEATLQGPACSWVTPTIPAALYVTPSGADGPSSVKPSSLRRSSTMPTIGSRGSASLASLPAYTNSATFTSTYSVAPVFPLERSSFADATARLADMPSSFEAATSWFGTVVQTSSPSMSTPTLTYSPASTTSSEDCERTVSMSSIMDMPASGGAVEFCGRSASSMDDLSHLFEVSRADLKLPALKRTEPMVFNAPMQLPPLSEAVPNPVLVERVLEPLPGLDSVSDITGLDFPNVFASWPVLGRS